MKQLIIIALIFCAHVVTAQKGNKVSLFDDSSYTIIPYTHHYNWVFENVISATLQRNEIKIIEKCLYDVVNDYNQKRLIEYRKYKKKNPNYTIKEEDLIINLKDYKIQLMPVTPTLNTKGSKMIWINCFCTNANHSNWKESIIQAKDGGKCYFNFKVNLATKKYYDFIVNGNA